MSKNDSESQQNVPRGKWEEISHTNTHTHARKAEIPTTKRPTAVAATRVVGAPLRLVVGVGSDPEAVAWAWGVDVVGETVGYGPGAQEGFNVCGRDWRLAWGLTAFGLDLERLTVGVILPPGQSGSADGSSDTYVSAVENIREVDDIACAGVEVRDEVYAALVIIFCRGTVSMTRHEFRKVVYVRIATSGVGAVRSAMFGFVTLNFGKVLKIWSR